VKPDHPVAFKPETAADAWLGLLAARGVEYLFANGGTDFAPVVEAYAKGQALGWRLPEVVIVPHENLGVAMAHGYTMITGRPQAMMVHVGVGTANAVNGLMNASRMNIPILFSAGRTPLTESGALPAARNNYIHWAQEHFDQGGMLREFMKWDYELRHPEQVETVLDRALAIAKSEPQGPVYVTLPREILAAAFTTDTAKTTTIAPATPPAADPEALEVIHHPGARGARCDGGLEPELARGDQVIDDPGQKLLEGGRFLVVEDLERLELRLVELRAGFLGQIDHRIERPRCGADDREPLLQRQLLAMFAVDPLPGAEDRDLRVDDQAVEVEDQCLDHAALQIALEELEDAPLHVEPISLRAWHVPLIRIKQRFEWLARIDQRLHQASRVPEVHILVDHPVDDEQLAA